MCNKTIIESGFCDIRNNQGLGKCNQPQPPASADYTCRDLDITNRIHLLSYYTHCFMENIRKLLCEMQVDFICTCKIQGQTHQVAASLETIKYSRSLAKVRSAHCARYNLQI